MKILDIHSIPSTSPTLPYRLVVRATKMLYVIVFALKAVRPRAAATKIFARVQNGLVF